MPAAHFISWREGKLIIPKKFWDQEWQGNNFQGDETRVLLAWLLNGLMGTSVTDLLYCTVSRVWEWYPIFV